MVRTFLKVYMERGSYFLFLQEQIKDIIIIKKKHHAFHAAAADVSTAVERLLNLVPINNTFFFC